MAKKNVRTAKAGRKGGAKGLEMKTDWARVSLQEARATAQLLVIHLVAVEKDAAMAGRKDLETAMRIEKNSAVSVRDRLSMALEGMGKSEE